MKTTWMQYTLITDDEPSVDRVFYKCQVEGEPDRYMLAFSAEDARAKMHLALQRRDLQKELEALREACRPFIERYHEVKTTTANQQVFDDRGIGVEAIYFKRLIALIDGGQR